MNETMVEEIVKNIQDEFLKVGKTPPAPNLLKQGVMKYAADHALQIWGVDDFIDVAAREGYPMCERVATLLLAKIEGKQSAEYGITWDTLTDAIDDWYEGDVRWEDLTVGDLMEYGEASFIIRVNHGESYTAYEDMSFVDVRKTAQDLFEQGKDVTVVTVPYGLYYDPTDGNEDDDFLEGKCLFVSTYFEKAVSS